MIIAEFLTVPGEVLGYSVRGPLTSGDNIPVLHWTYVKSAYRRQHIARALSDGCMWYTQRTPVGVKFAKSLDMKFNPWL